MALKHRNQEVLISSIGTGNHDGLASQLLCKLNAIMFSKYFGYKYVDIPFDDFILKGNGGHRYGNYSTALQNIIFTFPGFEKLNPLGLVYDGLKVIDFNPVVGKYHGFDSISNYIKEEMENSDDTQNTFVLNGFSNLFSDKTYLYKKISKGINLIIDPKYTNDSLSLSSKFKVSVHVRRGDITTNEVNHHRIIPMDYFNVVVGSVKEVLLKKQIDFEINLHMEGLNEGAEQFTHDHTQFNSLNPTSSFYDLFTSDLIISSKSSHSTVPGILSGGIVIYPVDSWMPALPDWIPADKAGFFDKSALDILITR
jgi:hypothetical protein